ncbi:histidine kinase [Catenulispora subtropica]|uniref:histidine kinase n=1 Tax=Catenulispora subtropica TaxID=450798 RepID=A0ABP5C935_9ACTN
MTGAQRTPHGSLGYFAFRTGIEARIVITTVAALALLGFTDMRLDYAPDLTSRVLDGMQILIVVARPVPILWYRRNPLAAYGGVLAISLLALFLVPSTIGGPWSFSGQVCVLAALAAAGSEAGRRRTVEMAAAYAMTTLVHAAITPGELTALAVVVGECVLVVGCLELVRDRYDARRALVVQQERTETERTHRTMLEERARIGRELHDVVAHHMSLIAVQAETAPYRFPGQSPEIEAEFRSISAASREALTDMRKILGLLRADSARAETAPQPRLADVPALVDEAGARLETTGDLVDVPPLAGVTAYRVVQESLSNARRHARGAEVTVRVARIGGAVWLEVRNGPASAGAAEPDELDEPGNELGELTEPGEPGEPGAPSGPAADPEPDRPAPDPVPGGGHGIAGMRERVALVHGEFEAGPTPDGGFAVVATLPLEG